MLEELQKTPDIDPSGLFSTYKTHPTESDETVEGEMNQISTIPQPAVIEEVQKKNGESNNIKALRIIIDGGVRITRAAVWSIAVFGGLFVAALATNTIDRAVYIINANMGTNIIISGEVRVDLDEKESLLQDQEMSNTSQGITSSAIMDSTSNIPDAIASKRRAILEARKAARLLEEKQKALEQLPQ